MNLHVGEYLRWPRSWLCIDPHCVADDPADSAQRVGVLLVPGLCVLSAIGRNLLIRRQLSEEGRLKHIALGCEVSNRLVGVDGEDKVNMPSVVYLDHRAIRWRGMRRQHRL